MLKWLIYAVFEFLGVLLDQFTGLERDTNPLDFEPVSLPTLTL
jgi:hypothetical protein